MTDWPGMTEPIEPRVAGVGFGTAVVGRWRLQLSIDLTTAGERDAP